MRILLFSILSLIAVSLNGCGLVTTSGKNVHVRGKVIDQLGKPVSNAIINYSLQYRGVGLVLIPAGGATIEAHKIEMDENGMFDLGEIYINYFSIININKSGYEYKFQKSSNIDSSQADKPLLFKLWKKESSQLVIKNRLRKRFKANGEFNSFDLKKGMFHPNKFGKGDFSISIKHDRQELGILGGDWTVKIKVNNGGVIESNDLYMNKAPLHGYMNEWSRKFKYPKSQLRVIRKFFIKNTQRNIYAALEIYFRPFSTSEMATTTITYTLNPAGKRVLY